MKKIITSSLLLLIQLLFSSYMPSWIPCGFECNKEWALEVRCGYYHLEDKTVTDIYPQGWFDYKVEAGRRLNDYFQVWTSVSWTGKNHGRLPDVFYGLDNKTRIHLIPIAVGLKAFIPLCSFIEFYLSGGVCYSLLSIKNHTRLEYDSRSSYYYGSYYYYSHYSYGDGYDYDFSKSVYKRHSSKHGFGGLGTVGIQYSMSNTTFLDIFAEYFAQSFHFSRHYGSHKKHDVFLKDVNFNGWKFGAGLGVYF